MCRPLPFLAGFLLTAWQPHAAGQANGEGVVLLEKGDGGKIPKKSKSPWRFGLKLRAESEYNSNPFHYSEADLDDFDDERGPGQRFDGLEEEWDVITTLSARGKAELDLGKKREAQLGAGYAYHLFLENSIGDYADFDLEGSYDITRKDQAFASVEWVFDRFKKNYRLPTGDFDAAEYDELSYVLGYERDLTKDWVAAIGIELEDREFDPDFSNRDRFGTSGFLKTELELTKRTNFGLRLRYGEFDVDPFDVGGVVIDRSFDQWSVRPALEARMGDWDLGVSFEYRRRAYTTDEELDGGRFNREDDRYAVGLRAERKLFKGAKLRVFAGWRENDANPDDPSIPTDETGYEEYTAGVGFSYSR